VRDPAGARHAPPASATRSSGNVFADLGFTPPAAARLMLRSAMMDRIESFMTERSLTQREAARFFGVSQPRISNLVRGRIDLFSIDTLVDMLERAGIGVELTLVASNTRRPQKASD
jgi:predicted XRE-type DNA-binding protein